MAADIITDIPVRGVRETTPPAPVEKVDRKEREQAPERPVIVEETPEPTPVPDARELERIVLEVQNRLKQLNTELRFEIDDNVEDLVVKIVDPETNEVIRQIPSQGMVELRERVDELVGFLLDETT